MNSGAADMREGEQETIDELNPDPKTAGREWRSKRRFFAIKMTRGFSVKDASGQTEIGKAGDYLCEDECGQWVEPGADLERTHAPIHAGPL